MRTIPRLTLRFRLAAAYCGLFLLTGGVLLTITYLLVQRSLPRESLLESGVGEYRGEGTHILLELPQPLRDVLNQEAAQQRSAALQQLLTQSGLALGIMVVVAVALGWLMAGRVLRPLRHVIAAAHRLSTENLHERIRPHRPDDEFKDLTETLNGMLDRLEAGFEAQRRFAATASHELRTPLTVQRSAVEVALADPRPSVESLRRMALKVQAATERHERLIDSLLVLARGQARLDRWQPADLADLARSAIAAVSAHGVRITGDLRPAPVLGDAALLERLVMNIVGNAVRHNVPAGWAHVRTAADGCHTVLDVANSGPPVPADVVASLFQAFRRHDRPGAEEGFGLGLSIVAAVTRSHGGTLSVAPRDEGGLRMIVRLPGSHG
ncbi:ATP-binding protein [Nonomuraea sp. B1E8]|uniref:sensor histidine kinase n=1 Tax=unclassified Nonomuraea TaxID=2593643 RepID=UPI00325D4D75